MAKHNAMKKIAKALGLLFICIYSPGFYSENEISLIGAWYHENGSVEEIMIFQDGYFTSAVFDKQHKNFIGARGGKFHSGKQSVSFSVEYDSQDSTKISNSEEYAFGSNEKKGRLIRLNGREWVKLDDGHGALAGKWRMGVRLENNQGNSTESGTVRRLKILSGKRFQSIEYDVQTNEFIETSGGTYTFKNGVYTENIEFSSSDSSQVGVSMIFDGFLESNVWTLKRSNAKGERVFEKWTRDISQ
jgi:hypothetical protein